MNNQVAIAQMLSLLILLVKLRRIGESPSKVTRKTNQHLTSKLTDLVRLTINK